MIRRGKCVHGLAWMPRARRSSRISSRIDDAEVEAELVPHLVAPLDLERGGADDEDRPGAVAEDQLLGDEAGLDRLAEADVVGDQQVDARHLDGPHDRVELVVLDLDAAAEGRLEGWTSAVVAAPQRTASRKASSRAGSSKPHLRQASLLEDLGAGFELPDHLQFLAQRVVVDRSQREQVLFLRSGKARTDDSRDDPLASTHLDQLALFGRLASTHGD